MDEIQSLEADISAATERLRVLRQRRQVAAQQNITTTLRQTLEANIERAEIEITELETQAVTALEKLDAEILERHRKHGANLSIVGASDGVAKATSTYVNLKSTILQKADALQSSRAKLAAMLETEATHARMQRNPAVESEAAHATA